MDISEIAQREVETSLLASRVRTERAILNGRIALFGGLTVIGLVSALFGPNVHYFRAAPLFWFSSWAVVAVVIRWNVDRVVASPVLSSGTAVLDFVAITLTPWTFRVLEHWAEKRHSAVPASEFEGVFYLPMMAVLLLIVATVHSLRSDARIAWVAHGLAAAGFVATAALVLDSLDPSAAARAYLDGQWLTITKNAAGVAGAAMLILGLLSARAARASRERMFEFARLTILRRMVPAAAVARVGMAGAQVSLLGERVTVTILASDLRGFTTMSEKLTPEAIVQELNDYHAAMLAVIDTHGGMLDKFIGDGALVVFGPDEDGDGAHAAVACAREMMLALDVHNAAREKQGRAPLAIAQA